MLTVMNLSIFNSKQLSVIRLELWNGWPTIFTIILGCFLTIISCSFLLQKINGTTTSQLNVITKDEVKVLILGNSQLGKIINPNKKILNLSLGGSDFSVQYEMLRHNAPKFKNLHLLILGFDNIPLRTPAVDRMRGDYRSITKMGVPWYSIPDITILDRLTYLLSYNQFMTPLLNGPKFDINRIRKLLSWLEQKKTTIDTPSVKSKVNLEPDIIRHGFYTAPSQGAKKIQDYMRALEKENNYDSNLAALYKIINYCIGNNIDIILLRTPTTFDFMNGRSNQWKEELQSILSSIKNIYPDQSMPFLDADQLETYDLKYFEDPNHLSEEGKNYYSKYLNAKLEPYIN